jgi:hypothetical protein
MTGLTWCSPEWRSRPGCGYSNIWAQRAGRPERRPSEHVSRRPRGGCPLDGAAIRGGALRGGRSQGGPRWVSVVSEAHDQGPQPVPRCLDRLNGRDSLAASSWRAPCGVVALHRRLELRLRHVGDAEGRHLLLAGETGVAGRRASACRGAPIRGVLTRRRRNGPELPPQPSCASFPAGRILPQNPVNDGGRIGCVDVPTRFVIPTPSIDGRRACADHVRRPRNRGSRQWRCQSRGTLGYWFGLAFRGRGRLPGRRGEDGSGVSSRRCGQVGHLEHRSRCGRTGWGRRDGRERSDRNGDPGSRVLGRTSRRHVGPLREANLPVLHNARRGRHGRLRRTRKRIGGFCRRFAGRAGHPLGGRVRTTRVLGARQDAGQLAIEAQPLWLEDDRQPDGNRHKE